MTSDRRSPEGDGQLTAIDFGHRARVIVLRGVIRDTLVDELRARLLTAIEGGVREVVLDLSDVESFGASVHDLVSAASITFADRGGVLLVWSRRDVAGDQTYVITEVRDRAFPTLAPSGPSSRQGVRP
jgi:anti-anti-sigma regulatory factor